MKLPFLIGANSNSSHKWPGVVEQYLENLYHLQYVIQFSHLYLYSNAVCREHHLIIYHIHVHHLYTYFHMIQENSYLWLLSYEKNQSLDDRIV